MISAIQGSTSQVSQMGPPPGNMGRPPKPTEEMQEELFSKIDANGDGQIDKAEISSFSTEMAKLTGHEDHASDMLGAADADGDGILTKEEFMNFQPPKPPQIDLGSFMYSANSQEIKAETTGALLDLLS